MNKYIPFLKMKPSEIGAVLELASELKEKMSVFFEVPRIKDGTSEQYGNAIEKAARSVGKKCSDVKEIYLDVFDVPPDMNIGGKNIYDYALDLFSPCNPIPVLGIDRSESHNNAAMLQDSDIFCLRIQAADFESFELFYQDLKEIADDSFLAEKTFDLVFDCRYCVDLDASKVSSEIVAFRKQTTGKLKVRRTVVVGSSIPASIGEAAATNSESTQARAELEIFETVKNELKLNNLYLGDYAITSPLYVDITLKFEGMWLNVLAPKIIYAIDGAHYIFRGGAIKTHPRKFFQYNDLCAVLIEKDFFRGEDYSWGDNYIFLKGNGSGPKVTPASIIKPTTNAHIMFMLQL